MISLLTKPDNAIVHWNVDESIRSCVNPLVHGTVGLSFSKGPNNIEDITLGFKGFEIADINFVPGVEYDDKHYNLLFNYAHDINETWLSSHPFKFELSCDKMYLPTSCSRYGDKTVEASIFYVTYYLYLRIHHKPSRVF